jgi:hypothetical protein
MCLLPVHLLAWCLSVICTCTFVRRISKCVAKHVAKRVALFFSHHYDPTILSSSNSSLPPLMSHTHSSSTSSNFQLIFDNALKTYKKCTKMDPLEHPLADRLQACDSPSSILTVLQEQLQQLNESQRSNTKWLDPTVNVLHTFSVILGEGASVSPVCFRTCTCPRSALSYLFEGIIACKGDLYRICCPSFSVYPS